MRLFTVFLLKTFTMEKVGGGRPKSTRGIETTQIQPKRRGEEGCEDEDVIGLKNTEKKIDLHSINCFKSKKNKTKTQPNTQTDTNTHTQSMQ